MAANGTSISKLIQKMGLDFLILKHNFIHFLALLTTAPKKRNLSGFPFSYQIFSSFVSACGASSVGGVGGAAGAAGCKSFADCAAKVGCALSGDG